MIVVAYLPLVEFCPCFSGVHAGKGRSHGRHTAHAEPRIKLDTGRREDTRDGKSQLPPDALPNPTLENENLLG